MNGKMDMIKNNEFSIKFITSFHHKTFSCFSVYFVDYNCFYSLKGDKSDLSIAFSELLFCIYYLFRVFPCISWTIIILFPFLTLFLLLLPPDQSLFYLLLKTEF